MDKNYKKALLTFLVSVLAFIAGMLALNKLNNYLSGDIQKYKDFYDHYEQVRNSPTEIIYSEESTPTETN